MNNITNATTITTPYSGLAPGVTIDNYPVVVHFQKQGQVGDRILMQLMSLILVVEVIVCCFCCLR